MGCEAGSIFAVTDHGQEAAREQRAVAEGVAGDAAVWGQQEAGLQGGQRIGCHEVRRAFPLQVAAEGGGEERGGDAAPLGAEVQLLAQQAAARVRGDVLPLGRQLRRIHGHDIAVAGVEEGMIPAAGGTGHLVSGGKTAGHTHRKGGGGEDACGSRGNDACGIRGGDARGGEDARGGGGGDGDSVCGGFPAAVSCRLPCHFPEPPVTSFLESGNDLPEVHGRAIAA